LNFSQTLIPLACDREARCSSYTADADLAKTRSAPLAATPWLLAAHFDKWQRIEAFSQNLGGNRTLNAQSSGLAISVQRCPKIGNSKRAGVGIRLREHRYSPER
jgi:hypothetical protein